MFLLIAHRASRFSERQLEVTRKQILLTPGDISNETKSLLINVYQGLTKNETETVNMKLGEIKILT